MLYKYMEPLGLEDVYIALRGQRPFGVSVGIQGLQFGLGLGGPRVHKSTMPPPRQFRRALNELNSQREAQHFSLRKSSGVAGQSSRVWFANTYIS